MARRDRWPSGIRRWLGLLMLALLLGGCGGALPAAGYGPTAAGSRDPAQQRPLFAPTTTPTPALPTPARAPSAGASIQAATGQPGTGAQTSGCPDARSGLPAPIVFGSGNNLLAMGANGGAVVPITAEPESIRAYDPAWSLDGTTLAFTLSQPYNDPDLQGLAVGEICALDRKTGKGRLLARPTKPIDSFEEAAWTADGRSLIVTWHQPQLDADKHYVDEVVTLVRYDLATGQIQPLAKDAGGASLSPDGQRLAFLHEDLQTGAFDLQLAQPDGTQTRPIQQPEYPFSTVVAPRWAPDSSKLVFTASGGPQTSAPARSPARLALERLLGIGVATAHGAPSYLWLVGADGKHLRRLYNQPLDDPRTAWSPDGTHIAYTGGGMGGVYLLTAAGGSPQRLTDRGDYGGIAWAAR